MAPPIGHEKAGGRQKGTPNKLNSEIREKYKEFVHNNLDNLESWLARVAAVEPDKAMDFMLKFSEYFIPKLQRTEHTGEDGGAIQQTVVWVIPNAKPLEEGSKTIEIE